MADEHYFQLNFPTKDELEFNHPRELKYRERVYCYELYHNIRKAMDEYHSRFPDTHFSRGDYVLDGEYDKDGYPIDEIKGKKPDFLVNQANTNSKNLVVIEVKPLRPQVSIKKDIQTIRAFLDNDPPGYFRGLMLVYGPDERALSRVEKQFNELVGKDQRISLMWHMAGRTRPSIREML